MTRTVDVVLRILLVALFAGSIAVQVGSVALAAPFADGAARVVLVCLIVAGGLCVEAVLVSVWVLAGMVHDESIFDRHSNADRWTNLAIGALGLAAVLAAAGFVFFAIDAAVSGGAGAGAGAAVAGDGSTNVVALAIATAAASVVAGALALLVSVMRRLLHTAVQYQSDLSEVI